MPDATTPRPALLFIADLTSRDEFLDAFGPFATATSILIATHRSELPESGARLAFRLTLSSGETMLAGQAVVTGNTGAGQRGVVRLVPTRLDDESIDCHAALARRARAGTADVMDKALDRLVLCYVLEEAQATGEISVPAADEPVVPDEPAIATDEPVLFSDEPSLAPARADRDTVREPLGRTGRAPTLRLRRRRRRGAGFLAAAATVLIVLVFSLRAREPERSASADTLTARDEQVPARAVTPPPASPAEVSLELDSSPPGATFRVNGVALGRGPASIRLPAGSTANISADFDGAVWHRRVIVVSDGSSMTIRAVLSE